ncbi:translation initiation factor IF-2 [bacterium SCSIO 12643]|nr:translation initiation factor IF-2 [bacterium SCSIO 12643]
MAGPTKRLNKIAKEFNVGVNTIAEFLKGKGHEIDASPNAKVLPEMYELLVEQYGSDKARKEKSQELRNKKVERKTISLEPEAPIRPTVVEKADPVSVEPPKETPKPEVKEEVETPAPVKEEVKTEEVKEPVVEEKPVVEVKETKPSTEVEINKGDQGEFEDGKGPKILGTIKLEEQKPKAKGKPKKKPEPPKEEPKKEKKPEPPKEEKKEEPKPSKPAEPEMVKAQVEKLTGPTVVGKIELPTKPEKKKKPVASSTNPNGNKRKPRKRIANPGGGQNNQGGNNRGGQNRSNQGGNNRGQNRRKGRKPEPVVQRTDEQIQKEISETLARLSGSKKSKGAKHRRAKRESAAQQMEETLAAQESQKKNIKVTEFVTVHELATMMEVSITDVISACMTLGMMVSINQRLDAETLSIVAEEFGFSVEFVGADTETDEVEEIVDAEEDLVPRAPIVTVMGHVDHGKTSLLDKIRDANVIAGEAGGITQHIGAYMVSLEDGREITFLDTPGHEAFTAMRARGAQVTDIAIIIISADDSVMPQTIEAINHAQAAGVPMVFAFNKMDRPDASADRIREQLSQQNILVEEWGGKYQTQEISAKTGMGIDDLLEKVLLEADLLELKANPDRMASGTIIEASLDKGRGYVTQLIVQTGTIRVGDFIVAGQYFAKVKALTDERGKSIREAGPSHAVSMLGFAGAPNAGDSFKQFAEEREAKQLASKREQLQREQGLRTQKHITLDEIGRRLSLGDFHELNVIVKGDVDGSVEALADSLMKLSTENIQVNVIHKSVGQISESDVLLATASDAIIVGFQVRPSASARRLADKEQIDIRLYSIIYDAIEQMKDAMQGMLKPKLVEEIVCNIEIRETFKISKVGTIAGCYVLDGTITRNTHVRVIRDGIVGYAGKLGSLKRFKDDVKEVKAGYECGLNIEGYNDIKVGDIIEGYEEREVEQKL